MVLFPKLSHEWHPIKNGKLTPQQVTKGYDKKVWWICSKGHEWKTSPNSRTRIKKKNNRTYFGSNCPFCSGLRVTPNKTIKVLFPELVKQWHPTKNGDLKPEHFAQSSNKKIWWFCSKGHEWKTRIVQRTIGRNCPKCSFQSSKPEFRILSELETLFKKVDSRYKFKEVEIDIFIKDINVGIEYDGSYYHKNKESRDRKKNNFLNRHSIKLIRVRKTPLKKLNNYDIVVQEDELNKKDLNRIVNTIYNFCNKEQKILINKYLKHKSFINNKLYRKYLSYFPKPIPQKSLSSFNIKFLNEWNYKKNFPLKPEFFSKGSNEKVWWLCSKKHEWQMPIKSRTRHGKEQNCPYCSGHKIDEKNNLKFLMPSLAKEWHPTKNGDLKPEHFSKHSNKKVWWLCSKGHEWGSTISNRSNGNNCYACYKLKKNKINIKFLNKF
jgi:very-short-patch-repair endonuclease